MPYIDDNDIVKCDLDTLYSGDILYDVTCDPEGDQDQSPKPISLIAFSESCVVTPEELATAEITYPAPMLPLQGWDSVDRICGD